jgi:3-oxoacyl-[acyl-carrier-protein] synthase II
MKAVIVESDMLTPYGMGVQACWEGLLSGRTAISPVTRFSTGAFQSNVAGTVGGLVYHERESLVMQMLDLLFGSSKAAIPSDARLVLATTKGEIDFLERSILDGGSDASESMISHLLRKVAELTGARGTSIAVSAACTSSAAAAARAAAMIRNNHADCVLVVACDSVTEFIYSGFSSLMALDKVPARPFDKSRTGLSVGEAAAFALLMSDERAARENRRVLGEIAGWGLSDDANHMTGPSRESEGLILAITKALASAGASIDDIGVIAAHGTGTVYNDAMEMRAFRAVFRNGAVPVYSIKGGIGHTMGAAGLVEAIIAQRALRERMTPPTVNMKEPDSDAVGWVSDRGRPIERGAMALVTNAGFSGVNTALVLS